VNMRLSARVDYALRAAAELAAAGAGPTTVGELAKEQDMPPKYLENILLQMRRAGLVRGQRGPEGGYVLARPAGEISLADVIRAVDGPLANVRGASGVDRAAGDRACHPRGGHARTRGHGCPARARPPARRRPRRVGLSAALPRPASLPEEAIGRPRPARPWRRSEAF
jgi:Rrf2 family protein